MNRYYDSSLHSSWLQNARQVTHSRGNQPGFPNQFQYIESQKNMHPAHDRMEYNTSYINEEIDITQNRRDRSILGERGQYEGMVPDIPFNQKYDTDVRNRMILLGFGSLILGTFLV
jgi:hypothetical protein